jgi:FixJ family two-component response regulator
MNSLVLIHMVDLDETYGMLVKTFLEKNNFKQVSLFTDENECLNNMKKKPKILITGYHLKNMSGLQLIKKAKIVFPNFYSILLSGGFHEDTHHVFDERFLQLVDKYIIKGMDDLQELIEAVTYSVDN